MPSKQYIHYWNLCDLIISWHNNSKTRGRKNGERFFHLQVFILLHEYESLLLTLLNGFLLSWISDACRALLWERLSSLQPKVEEGKLIQRNPMYLTAVAFPASDLWNCFLFHNLHKLNKHLFFSITCFTNQCLKCNIEALLSTQASCAGFTVAACQEPEGFTCAQVR